jgi:two-component system response regulator AtoC
MNALASHPSDQLADVSFVSGRAASMPTLNAVVAEIAKTDIPVLLVGESGTGKEVYARLIHRLSGLSGAPLKKVSCAVIEGRHLVREMQEALSGKENQVAGPRTVFLDGIHELDFACQRVLLSLLPDGAPNGFSEMTVSRIISSTPRNLEQEISAGRFLHELYYRINGAIVRLPPLRERKEDIPSLMECFFLKHSKELRKGIPNLSGEARELLTSYDWPGNIRELENVAKKIIALGDPALALADLGVTRASMQTAKENSCVSSLKMASRAASQQAERELIQKALEQTHWNRKRAAQFLEISYKSLLSKIKQTGLERKKTERE